MQTPPRLRHFAAAIVTSLPLAALAPAAHAGAYEDFFRAVELDDARSATRLLQRGFDPNSHDEKGQAALFIALRGQSLKVAKVLWEHPGTEIDLRNSAGETPLMMAALRGEAQAVKGLIEHGAAVQQPGWTPLHYAATGGNAEVVKLLLEHGAALEARSPNGSTPLMLAARYGSEEAVDVLLTAGAKREAKNDLGLNAAAFASDAGRDRLAKRLQVAADKS